MPNAFTLCGAALAMVAAIAGCARPAMYTSDLRCPDARPRTVVKISAEAQPSAESAGLLVVVHAKDGDGLLEPGSVRVFPRDAAIVIRAPRPDSLGYYAYHALRPGWYLVEVRKVGYDPAIDSLELHRGSRSNMSVWIGPKCL